MSHHLHTAFEGPVPPAACGSLEPLSVCRALHFLVWLKMPCVHKKQSQLTLLAAGQGYMLTLLFARHLVCQAPGKHTRTHWQCLPWRIDPAATRRVHGLSPWSGPASTTAASLSDASMLCCTSLATAGCSLPAWAHVLAVWGPGGNY